MTKKQVNTDLTKREAEFCRLYSRYAGNLPMVCERMKITVGSARNLLCKPAVKEHLQMALQRSREMIVAGTPEVVRELYRMLYDERTPIKVKAQIATSLLDRAGLCIPTSPPVQVNINTELIDRARLVLAEKVDSTRTVDTTATPSNYPIPTGQDTPTASITIQSGLS